MGGVDGTSNGVSSSEEVRCLKRDPSENGFQIRTLTDSGQSSVLSVGLQTYKRRKFGRSSSESKGLEDGRVSMEAASKLEDETVMEQLDCLPKNQASLNYVLHNQCRTFNLECICRSLNNDEGGIQSCISDTREVKRTGADHKDKENCTSEPLSMPNGTHCAAGGHIVMSNESSNGTHRPVTEMCQNVFSNIIHSEKFTLLCKLLFENFPELKTDNLLGLSPIHRKMKDGTYEHSPWSFHTDVQMAWKKIQDFGNEVKSAAECLSDVSRTCYNEQFYPREAYLNGKSEDFDLRTPYKVCTCRHCGGKADVRECLVCDSCEETYHAYCIEPSFKEIRPRNWYCGSCIAGGLSSPHEDCVVCARLNAPRKQCTQPVVDKQGSSNEKTRDTFLEPSDEGCRSICRCKICDSEVENGGKLMICGHNDCSFKYYHMRCLTVNLLKSHGPRWYCPSCLCRVCLNDKDDDKIVLCDGCDNGYHMYCLNPPLDSVPDGKWFCRHCDAKIGKIRSAKRQYEKRNLGKGREGMDILLTAALEHTSNSY